MKPDWQVGNAGDSRAIVLDGPKAIPLSIDCNRSRGIVK